MMEFKIDALAAQIIAHKGGPFSERTTYDLARKQLYIPNVEMMQRTEILPAQIVELEVKQLRYFPLLLNVTFKMPAEGPLKTPEHKFNVDLCVVQTLLPPGMGSLRAGNVVALQLKKINNTKAQLIKILGRAHIAGTA